jgi:hypothetical protein
VGKHIDGDDMADIPGRDFGDDKAGNIASAAGALCGFLFGHNGKGAPPPHIRGQFLPGIRDTRRKALLINLPEELKIARAEFSEAYLHGNIVASGSLAKLP